ncbi:Initiator tRNA phosphoribosyl transferase [Mycena indigotica]|uniref:Initiator tRNA phosphoribosyl transferase n=1 Tax=Mycena indigotica TaxID=2126181 RepID=A0A8H6RZ84_9AGAR|nr:Initiator tRNA phosphoribosyl transferase [Mycena indigotica]KAF7289305.1 Initiator tRNA phosphoribosyl transferase [Mycena indigotica]
MFNHESDDREALKQLRKESLDLYNRLKSIELDISFVNDMHKAYCDIPILPNLRCGAWYTDPDIRATGEVKGGYFKSTDGHYNAWRFSLRRPNLHLLPVAAENGGKGLILVDSTRAGKRFPDALSKTVPIWCAVLNRALLIRRSAPGSSSWDTSLHTPPSIPTQEAAQITSRLDEWARELACSSYSLPDLPRPLRPIWVTPAHSAFPHPPQDCIPIICASASAEGSIGRRAHGFSYIQGAGDDHELWGMGLTPELFWQHRTALLGAERADLPSLVARLVSGHKPSPGIFHGPTPIQHAGSLLLLAAAADINVFEEDVAYVVVGVDRAEQPLPRVLYLPITCNTRKSRSDSVLPSLLPRSTSFATHHLRLGRRVCFVCDDGRDVSVGLALVTLGLLFDDAGKLASDNTVTKAALRTRLEWIVASRPEANPSRATLKRVNEFLMSGAYTVPMLSQDSSVSDP